MFTIFFGFYDTQNSFSFFPSNFQIELTVSMAKRKVRKNTKKTGNDKNNGDLDEVQLEKKEDAFQDHEGITCIPFIYFCLWINVIFKMEK